MVGAVSAKAGTGLDTLLESIVLTADAALDLRANPTQRAQGLAIEAHPAPPRAAGGRRGPPRPRSRAGGHSAGAARHPARRRLGGLRSGIRPGPGGGPRAPRRAGGA